MGTSTPPTGPRDDNPTNPSWSSDQTDSKQASRQKPIPEAGEAGRFREARRNFSKFARSDGKKKQYLARSLECYISDTVKTHQNATQRMKESRDVTIKLTDFLTVVNTKGLKEAMKDYELKNLDELVDKVCSTGGSIDESIARNAFVEVISEISNILKASDDTDLDGLDEEKINEIFEIYIARTIELRIYHDIGIKVINLPSNAATINQVLSEVDSVIRPIVRQCIKRALGDGKGNILSLTQSEISKFIERAYGFAFKDMKTIPDFGVSK